MPTLRSIHPRKIPPGAGARVRRVAGLALTAYLGTAVASANRELNVGEPEPSAGGHRADLGRLTFPHHRPRLLVRPPLRRQPHGERRDLRHERPGPPPTCSLPWAARAHGARPRLRPAKWLGGRSTTAAPMFQGRDIDLSYAAAREAPHGAGRPGSGSRSRRSDLKAHTGLPQLPPGTPLVPLVVSRSRSRWRSRGNGDQAVDQLAGGGRPVEAPEQQVHRDAGEAGEGVELVDEEAILVLQKEIRPGRGRRRRSPRRLRRRWRAASPTRAFVQLGRRDQAGRILADTCPA